MPQSKLTALDSLLQEIQSYWIEDQFSTGDTVARENVWILMQSALDMIPRVDKHGAFGFNLEDIDQDYEAIERLFFAQSSTTDGGTLTVETDTLQPSQLHELHRYNPKKKLLEADELRLSRVKKSAKKSAQKTSPSKAAA